MSSRARSDSDDDSDDEDPTPRRPTKKVRTAFIDDAAEEEDEHGRTTKGNEDEEEEEDDDDNKDYVKDGFVVDEVDAARRRGDLSDSDDDDDDDDDNDSDDGDAKKSRLKKVRKMKRQDVLVDDDLALVQEALQQKQQQRGGNLGNSASAVEADDDFIVADDDEKKKKHVVVTGRTADELQRGLFATEAAEEAAPHQQQRANNRSRAPVFDEFDEDADDGFIEDDIGDQRQIMASEHAAAAPGGGAVSEAQLQAAADIFGTEYLDFLQEEDGEEDDRKQKHKERGVGIDYGIDDSSDASSSSDEDDDLFGDDDDDDDNTTPLSAQKAEALRLHREKRKLAKAERKKQAALRKASLRQARLRRAFEPVTLAENFLAPKDELIRKTDVPERMFDVPLRPAEEFPEDGEADPTPTEWKRALWIAKQVPELSLLLVEGTETTDETTRWIVHSIVWACRFYHRDKFEVSFIRYYRQDYVTDATVQEHLAEVMEQDAAYQRLEANRTKAVELLGSLTAQAEAAQNLTADEAKLSMLKEELQTAQESLDDTVKEETQLQGEITALGGDDDDDDDDELFGDEDNEGKKSQREQLSKHLATTKELMAARSEKVSGLKLQVAQLEAHNAALLDPAPRRRVQEKLCTLYHAEDFKHWVTATGEARLVSDLQNYLNLIEEGNAAIRKKEMPSAVAEGSNSRKRSRRTDRDFYRTCVSEGMRAAAYKFLLVPHRVGIKLEEISETGQFDYSKTLPGETTGASSDWVPPTLSEDPVAWSTTNVPTEDFSATDPLKGCRYVAAIELASEPRVRQVLRKLYRKLACLTTRPTRKGLEEIDAFHDLYGVHLIRNKMVSDHFPPETDNAANLSTELRKQTSLENFTSRQRCCLQYLQMLKAEQTRHITLHIHLPFKDVPESWYRGDQDSFTERSNQDISSLLEALQKAFMPLDEDRFDEERRKVMKQALETMILPLFEAELRRDLREAAFSMGAQVAATSLRTMAMEGPYRPKALLLSENRFLVPTEGLVLAGMCCATDPKEASFLAAITSTGASNDYLAIPGGVDIGSNDMKQKLMTFLMQHRPAAVIVGTSGGQFARRMEGKLALIVDEAVKQWQNRAIQGEEEDDEAFETRRHELRKLQGYDGSEYDEDDEWTCNVELVDDTVSQLFGRSVRSQKEFPDYSVNLRCAISVARYARDPLAEICYAWSVASDTGTFGTEMLFINVHEIQQLVPKTRLLRHYERVLCDVVAQVGVDMNIVCTHDHLKGLLVFVAGLGPRKVANLKQSVSQIGGAIARRRDFLEKRLMGPVVYCNAVAFLKIMEVEQLGNELLHPLDETRVHPDVYNRNNWATAIAFNSLDRENPNSKEGAIVKALHDVMDNSTGEVERLLEATKKVWTQHYGLGNPFNVKDWDPKINVPAEHWKDNLEQLDLEVFAKGIEQRGQGRWRSHLEMLKWEFRLPFADVRRPMQKLPTDKLFHLLSGETDQSLRPGKEVTGKVTAVSQFGARVQLEGNINAFIPTKNIADQDVESANDYLSQGQMVTALVTVVKKDHMVVDLTLKRSDFQKSPNAWERPDSLFVLDACFDSDTAVRIEDHGKNKREAHIEAVMQSIGQGEDKDETKVRGRVVRRACTHPAFRNGSNSEVDREIRDAGAGMVGEALIRPSNKSRDSLAAHWVVREGHVKIIEIAEEQKESDTSIGNILKVKEESYGSIDELLGRLIAPMNDLVEEVIHHRKFLDMTEDEVDEKLQAQKKAAKNSIPYAICWLDAHPGYASLRFFTSRSRDHPIGISAKGFVWGSTTYNHMEKLLMAFKKDPRGPVSKPKPPKPLLQNSTTAAATAAPPGPSRWGSKPAPPPPTPPVPPPYRPPPPPVQVYRPPPPPPPLPPAAPPGIPVGAGGPGQWGQPRPPPMPQHAPPPPMYNAPPPPGPPPPAQGFPPPGFPAPEASMGRGRGRGRTLPAWMSKT